jgi:hypothetical protein
MRDTLGAAKQRLAREIDSNSALPSEPIAADPWVVSSLLQKSIRRGERELAKRAAFTFFHHKGAAVWRRLMVIAFEDIGIGSIDALTTTIAAAGDSAWRKNHGGDLKLAVYLAGLLAEAPKDRSADYLCDANDHPMLADFWRAMEKASLDSKLSHVGDQALSLPQQAVVAVSALGTGSHGRISPGTGVSRTTRPSAPSAKMRSVPLLRNSRPSFRLTARPRGSATRLSVLNRPRDLPRHQKQEARCIHLHLLRSRW